MSLIDSFSLQNTLVKYHKSHGYQLIDTPIIDEAELFLVRAGDKIVENLFLFEHMGKTLALRPEFTTTAMMKYIHENHQHAVRWQFFGSTFEDKPSDFSGKFQHLSAGIELIGIGGVETDAETLDLAFKGVMQLGLSNPVIFVGHVGLQLHLLSQFGLDTNIARVLMNQRDLLHQSADKVIENIAKTINLAEPIELFNNSVATSQMVDVLLDSTQYSNAMGGRSRQEISNRLVHKNARRITHQQLQGAIDFLFEWSSLQISFDEFDVLQKFVENDEQGQAILSAWKATLDLTVSRGISPQNIVIKPDLTQNWDYYTGIVFHVYAGEKLLVSGGRYDELGYLMNHTYSIPAIGFAYYLDELSLPKTNKTPILVLSEPSSFALEVTKQLRENGLDVVLQSSSIPNMTTLTISNQEIHLGNSIFMPSTLNQLISTLKAL
jgi:ATP phosphoribosyltransferase regulatory subunit